MHALTDPEDKAWFRSSSAPESKAYLTANRKEYAMSDREFVTAVRMDLRLPTLENMKPGDSPKRCNRCKRNTDAIAKVDCSGKHGLRCKDLGKMRTWRHTHLGKVIYDGLQPLRRRGSELQWEPLMVSGCDFVPQAGHRGEKDRGDILIRRANDPESKVVMDVSVIDPLQPSMIPRASTQTGFAAQARFDDKVKSYLRRFKIRKAQIIPIAIELGGRIAKESKKLLDRWIDSTVDNELEAVGAEHAWLKIAERRRVYVGLSVMLRKLTAQQIHKVDSDIATQPALYPTFACSGITPATSRLAMRHPRGTSPYRL